MLQSDNSPLYRIPAILHRSSAEVRQDVPGMLPGVLWQVQSGWWGKLLGKPELIRLDGRFGDSDTVEE